MNRDERRDRAPENSPVLHHGDISWLAPSDSERGGTWIAVNELGVVTCIMNGYVSGESPAPPASSNVPTRGAIIPRLIERGGLQDIRNALVREFDPAPYPSFTLILAHHGAVESFDWRGNGMLADRTHDDVWSAFSSSSWKTDEVIAWRMRAFDLWRADGCKMTNDLPSLHLQHPDGMREWSPLMDREHTCTRSITQVEIARGRDKAVMRYWRRDALDAGRAPFVTTLPLHLEQSLTHHG